MNVELAHSIDAPAGHVWAVYVDVRRWPEWTPSVRDVDVVEPDQLDGDDAAPLPVGTMVRIAQPRMPELTWVVTELTPGRSWTWRSASSGVATTATHEIEPIGATACRVRQLVVHRGPLAWVIGPLTRRRTRRYLEQEGAGLRRRAETTWNADAAAS